MLVEVVKIAPKIHPNQDFYASWSWTLMLMPPSFDRPVLKQPWVWAPKPDENEQGTKWNWRNVTLEAWYDAVAMFGERHMLWSNWIPIKSLVFEHMLQKYLQTMTSLNQLLRAKHFKGQEWFVSICIMFLIVTFLRAKMHGMRIDLEWKIVEHELDEESLCRLRNFRKVRLWWVGNDMRWKMESKQ